MRVALALQATTTTTAGTASRTPRAPREPTYSSLRIGLTRHRPGRVSLVGYTGGRPCQGRASAASVRPGLSGLVSLSVSSDESSRPLEHRTHAQQQVDRLVVTRLPSQGPRRNRAESGWSGGSVVPGSVNGPGGRSAARKLRQVLRVTRPKPDAFHPIHGSRMTLAPIRHGCRTPACAMCICRAPRAPSVEPQLTSP